jgi:hypothetical protein
VLRFRPAVVLEAIELRYRIAALERDRTRGPCFRSLGSCSFGSCPITFLCEARMNETVESRPLFCSLAEKRYSAGSGSKSGEPHPVEITCL